MSPMETWILAGVIAAFAVFAVALAGGSWYERVRAKRLDARAQTGSQDVGRKRAA